MIAVDDVWVLHVSSVENSKHIACTQSRDPLYLLFEIAKEGVEDQVFCFFIIIISHKMEAVV